MTAVPPASTTPVGSRRNKTSGINTVAIATNVPDLVDLVVSHTLRLWENAQSDVVLERAQVRRRPIFSEKDSIPMLLLKECASSLSFALTELVANALTRLIAALEIVLRMTAYTDDPGWNMLVGWSTLERALSTLDVAHESVVRAAMVTLLLGPPTVAAKAASPGAGSSKALARGRAIRDAGLARASDAPSSFKLLLSGADITAGRRIKLHQHSGVWHVEPTTNSSEEQSKTSLAILVEYRAYDPADHTSLRRVRDVVALLQAAGHRTTAILPAKGFVPRPHTVPRPQCEIIYTLPNNVSAANSMTLRAALLDPRNNEGVRHPIAERLALARRITRALLFLHAAGVTHGDVRPENVLLVYPEPPIEGEARANFPWALGTSYLVGLDFDPSNPTLPRRDVEPWWVTLYRHPTEHQPLRRRCLLNDIYALGIVLLEVALWRSIITVDEVAVDQESRPTRPSTAESMTHKRAGSVPNAEPPNPALVISNELASGGKLSTALARAKTLSSKGRGDTPAIKRTNSEKSKVITRVPDEVAQELKDATAPQLPLSSDTTLQPVAASTVAATPALKYRPSKMAVGLTEGGGKLKDPLDMQKAFSRKAVEYIPLVLGERYRDAVMCCLNDGAFGRKVARRNDEEDEPVEEAAEDPEKDKELLCAVLMRILGLLEEVAL